MKTAIVFFLLGAIAGGFALHFYQRHEAPPAAAPREPKRKAQDAGTGAKDSIDRKLAEWKLTPGDIKDDLARTGEVVRAKTAEVGSRIDDARIVAVVKAKFVIDSELSALAIDVQCRGGEVTLSGTVKSPELIGRAVVQALETHGVHNVVSHLTVKE